MGDALSHGFDAGNECGRYGAHAGDHYAEFALGWLDPHRDRCPGLSLRISFRTLNLDAGPFLLSFLLLSQELFHFRHILAASL